MTINLSSENPDTDFMATDLTFGAYELKVSGSNEVITKYYSAGSSRIAYRINGEITWLLNDHLGSTVGMVDADGELIGVLKYTAYGELRTGSSTTDYRYTGQRGESEIGLYYYVARFYDPYLNRFLSPDTIVPDPGQATSFDHYAYTSYNPIKYSDPTGHMETGECGYQGQDCGTQDESDYYQGYINLSTGYFRPSPVAANYDEESFNDSGNPSLNNAVGVNPIYSGTWVDAVVLVIQTANYIDANTNIRNSIYQAFDKPPQVVSGVFYDDYVTGITVNDDPAVRVSEIRFSNLFYESIDYTTVDFSFTNTENGVTNNDTLYLSQRIESMGVMSIKFDEPILIPRGYNLTISLSYSANGWYSTTEHNIHP